MAPRRSTVAALDVHNLFGLDDQFDIHHDEANLVRCCVPTTECLKINDFGLINLDDMTETYVRVICSNDACTQGNYMHRECFDAWEISIMAYLKSMGRARSWTDKQRSQNLWTKKGYEMVLNACTCKCNRGHLKKDLDWIPPQQNTYAPNKVQHDDDLAKLAQKNKKKRNRTKLNSATNKNVLDICGLLESTSIRPRANSLSSSNGSSSPPASSNSEQSVSPIHSNVTPFGNNNNGNVAGKNLNPRPLTPKSMVELYSDRVR